MPPPRSSRVQLLPFVALLSLGVTFRLPALVNAATLDSDAAIVGLQARHILRGEWSWFLYGSGYQTSVDSWVAALLFVLFGATPLALILSTLAGHLAATWLAFATLARHLPRSVAFVATLPLVFTSAPLHTYILNPPRQAALTLVFLSLFVTDGASARSLPRHRLFQHAAGAAIAGLACFADPYALLFFPALIAVGLTREARSWTLAGAALGLVPFLFLLASPRSVHGEATLTLAVVRHNAALLVDPCLPWALGVSAFVPRALLGYVPWSGGPLVTTLQRFGGLLFSIAVLSGGVALVRGRAPWPVRRLGGFGFGVAVLTVASFLVSVMVMDLFSSRYLAALVLASPFAIAPLGLSIGPRRLFAWLAPYLVATGLCGWVGYGDEVSGAHVVELPGQGAEDERLLEAMLLERGIHAAIADYWVSYRLTFLYEERVVVVPIHEREDRYAPYREVYARAGKSAYIFDPKRSRENLEAMEAEAFHGEHVWGKPIERLHVGALTAVVFERGPAP